MKRRSFLAMIGLAPVAASVPAAMARDTRRLVITVKNINPDAILRFENGQLSIGTVTAGVIRSGNTEIDIGAGKITHFDVRNPSHQWDDKESWT